MLEIMTSARAEFPPADQMLGVSWYFRFKISFTHFEMMARHKSLAMSFSPFFLLGSVVLLWQADPNRRMRR